MAKRGYVPPDRVSAADVFKILSGALCLIFGLLILVRTLPYGLYLPALVSAASFIGYGAYRLWTAWIGWQMYRAAKGGKRP